MKFKIKLFCSSFLISKKSIWENINLISSKLSFAEYGKIIPAIENINDYDVNVAIVFHQDIHNTKLIENKRYAAIILQLEEALKKNKGAFIFGYSSYLNNQVTRLAKKIPSSFTSAQNFKKKLYSLASKYPDLHILDLDPSFSELGYSKIFDIRNWYFSHMRLSLIGLNVIDDAIALILHRIYNSHAKVLVLDCDNTLWGGIIGEDGLSKIVLGSDGIGKAYSDFQISTTKLLKSGILLSLCSKNNEKDVWNVFKSHPQMVIKRNQIANAKINWNEKYLNLIEMGNELSLGLDSFVFWDDDPVERAKIKNKLPEVNVIDVPTDVTLWPKKLDELNLFAKFDVHSDDRKKLTQYKSKVKFERKKVLSNDIQSFLKTIKLKPQIKLLDKASVSRATQLSQKTNQFNFRTQRYNESHIINLLDDKNNNIYICSAKDVFGDYGQIALAIIKKIANKQAFLDTFLMSCRILGRDIELWFLQSILDKLSIQSIDKLIIEYIPNERNIIVNDFIKKCKIKKITSSYDYKGLSGKIFEINTNAKITNIKNLYG